MQIHRLSWLLSYGLCAFSPVSAALQKISLDEVSTLNLVRGGLTTGKSPVDQLACVGGSAKNLYAVDEMTCRNIAGQSKYREDEINWRCEARLPEEFRLGSTDVSCLPWTAPTSGQGSEGNWIVEGSCRVEYVLMLTDVGEEKFAHLIASSAGVGSSTTPTTKFEYLFWIIFLGVAGYILYSIFFSSPSRSNRVGGRGRRRHGRGTGGSDDNEDDDDSDDGLPPHFYDAARNPSDGRGRENASWMPLAATGIAASGAVLATSRSGLTSRTRNGASQVDDRRGGTEVGESSTAPPLFMTDRTFGESRMSSGFGGTSHRD